MQTSVDVLGEVYFSLCKGIDTPVALSCWLRFRYGGLRLLSELKVDPANYVAADAFAVDYACSVFLSKYQDSDVSSSESRKSAALAKFYESERCCELTNSRWDDPLLPALRPDSLLVLHQVKRKIARVLGPFEFGKVLPHCEFGPGATNGVSRRRAYVDVKQSDVPTVTPSCIDFALAWLSQDIHWFSAITRVMPEGPYSALPASIAVCWGNRVVTVPKTFDCDRTIAAEPTFNGFFQRGVGRYIRRRLKGFGVDLDNQETNRTLASKACSLGLATIDLSSASDTIASSVVRELLPIDWWLYLDRLRSHYYEDPSTGQLLRYTKFSSMGNAFTFELESLIFWAVTSSVSDVASIFGDDIICRQSDSARLIAVLEDFGFKTNVKKSYVTGSFFESCGGHYFDGFEVTPVYQREPLSDESSFIRCHNRLCRLAVRQGMGVTTDERFVPAIRAVRRLGRFDRSPYRIPFHPSDGDDGWLTSGRDLRCLFDKTLGYARCRVLVPKVRGRSPHQTGALAFRLRSQVRDMEWTFRPTVYKRGSRVIDIRSLHIAALTL